MVRRAQWWWWWSWWWRRPTLDLCNWRLVQPCFGRCTAPRELCSPETWWWRQYGIEHEHEADCWGRPLRIGQWLWWSRCSTSGSPRGRPPSPPTAAQTSTSWTLWKGKHKSWKCLAFNMSSLPPPPRAAWISTCHCYQALSNAKRTYHITSNLIPTFHT